MKLFVVSDPHGFYGYLMKALTKAGFFDALKNNEDCRLVVCGDLLDRGSEAVALVNFMLDLEKQGKLIYIFGNHEELLDKCLRDIDNGGIYDIACGMSYHYSNCTWHTLLQLSKMTELEAYNAPQELIQRVKSSRFYTELLPTAINYYETQNYIFVHGWLPYDATFPDCKPIYMTNWREAKADGWHASRWGNGMELCCKHGIKEDGKTVVCGHWNASFGHSEFEKKCSEFGADADHTPFYSDGIIAIDADTALSETVNCVVIEDNELSITHQ